MAVHKLLQQGVVRLVEDGLSGDEIQKTLGMNEKKIEILLKSLERSGVVSRRNGLFGYEMAAAAESTTSVGFALDSAQKGHIDIKNSRGFVDISNVDLDYFYNREHDTVSRLMAMVARVLKQKKKVEEDELRAHVTAMCGEMVDDELYQGVLKQAQERGLFEKHGTNYTYMI
ncbi:hypothetical protein ECANGB1_660 [Enterospora canceri]|uniref:Uncharacterized protein n=1 Tax=Enterospora canceri TaxID=1081671 RepID=A0A1Y1S492_9MICR|nr:hypothetical protein ECANGB1_660 [Enterospora canceri]